MSSHGYTPTVLLKSTIVVIMFIDSSDKYDIQIKYNNTIHKDNKTSLEL